MIIKMLTSVYDYFKYINGLEVGVMDNGDVLVIRRHAFTSTYTLFIKGETIYTVNNGMYQYPDKIVVTMYSLIGLKKFILNEYGVHVI